MRYFNHSKVRSSPGNFGVKAANLSLLHRHGFNIPLSIFLSVRAYREMIDLPQIDLKIRELKRIPGHQEMGNPENRLISEIKNLILKLPVSNQLSIELREMIQFFLDNGISRLALRSSSIYEDMDALSFAGQYETILDIEAEYEIVLSNLRKIWASQWNHSALTYMARNMTQSHYVGMGVVIQEMIFPDISGVLFSQNPVSINPDEICIEYTEGISAELVRGEDNPRQVYYNRKERELKSVLSRHKVHKQQLKTLIDETLRLEHITRVVCDIEWAISNSELFLLQYRPIQNPTRKRKNVVLWTNRNVGEVIPDIVTPLTWEIMGKITNSSFIYFLRHIGLRSIKNIKLFDVFRGKVYFNESLFDDLLEQFYIRKRIKKTIHEKQYINMMLILVQVIIISLKTLLLLTGNTFRIKRFLKQHKKFASNEKQRENKKLDGAISRINNILKIHQQNMNLHVTSTILGDVFYQGMDRIGKDWKVFKGDMNVDALFRGANVLMSAEIGLQLWNLYLALKKESYFVLHLRNEDPTKQEAYLKTEFPALYKKYKAFISEYGHNAQREFELIYPRWAEKPEEIFGILKNYLNLPLNYDPIKDQWKLKKQNKQNIARIKQELNPVKRRFFSWWYHRTINFVDQREILKQKFLQTHGTLRQEILNIAEHFIERDFIDRKEDIFYLKLGQIKEIIEKNEIQLESKETIESLKNKRFKDQKLKHPDKFYQIGDQVEWVSRGGLRNENSSFIGTGCSAGVVNGTLRIVNNPSEIKNFEHGDIILARAINPSWTPLFIMAGGIVTEIGGALSHSAIIAREYGIPMVAGIPGITESLIEGQQVQVNGNEGTVSLLDAPNG